MLKYIANLVFVSSTMRVVRVKIPAFGSHFNWRLHHLQDADLRLQSVGFQCEAAVRYADVVGSLSNRQHQIQHE